MIKNVGRYSMDKRISDQEPRRALNKNKINEGIGRRNESRISSKHFSPDPFVLIAVFCNNTYLYLLAKVFYFPNEHEVVKYIYK
jgi:hypothetical protein